MRGAAALAAAPAEGRIHPHEERHGSPAEGLQAADPFRPGHEEDLQGPGDDRGFAHLEGPCPGPCHDPVRRRDHACHRLRGDALRRGRSPVPAAERSISGRSGILLITADRGMAGAYSPNAIRAAEQLANTLRDQGKEPVMYVVGRKGDSYYRFRDRAPHGSWTPYKEHELPDLGREIAAVVTEELLTEDLDRHIDELFVVGHRFETRFVQQTRSTRLVPLGLVEAETAEAAPTFPLYAFTPDADTVLEELIPRYVEARIINILLQSMASEHASRQRAMKTATDNAETQIDKFTDRLNSSHVAISYAVFCLKKKR